MVCHRLQSQDESSHLLESQPWTQRIEGEYASNDKGTLGYLHFLIVVKESLVGEGGFK